MISFLHITQDNKFFDVIEKCFDTDSRITNTSIIIVNNYDYSPKFIREGANVTFIHRNDLKDYFENHSYDVVFFHGLPCDEWKVLKYINANTTTIWWAWGWDIYGSMYGLSPFIKLNLYKAITKSVEIRHNWIEYTKEFIKKITISNFHRKELKNVLRRVDFFQPVIYEDYKLMQKNASFNARLFYYKDSISSQACKYKEREYISPILIGNSATTTNNHFDIFHKLESLNIPKREIIVPFNYGDEWYIEVSVKMLNKVNLNIRLIRDFLPRDEYFDLIGSCGYAIFGIIRQQAMGNIYYCIRQGIKIFLFKDSVVYHYLKDYGYIVFSIDDMKKEDLETPLTRTEHEINSALLLKDSRERNEIYENVIRELQDKYKKND